MYSCLFLSEGIKGALEQHKSARKSSVETLSNAKPASKFSSFNVNSSLKTGDAPFQFLLVGHFFPFVLG